MRATNPDYVANTQGIDFGFCRYPILPFRRRQDIANTTAVQHDMSNKLFLIKNG